MKALRFYGHKDVRLQEVVEPTAKPGWSIVEVEYASICGSDLKEYVGPNYLKEANRVTLPVTLGHEFAGRVVQTKRSDLHAGDRVAVEPAVRDGSCGYCRQGNYILCDNLKMLGFDADGGFAEQVAVPDYSLHKLPPGVPDDAGALIEPLAVCVHAVRRGGVTSADTVVIVGAGMIGLGVLSVVLAAGVRAAHVIDRSPIRRRRAIAIGATDAVEARSNVTVNADIAFDCVGAGDSANVAIDLTRKGGRIVLVGIFNAPPVTNINELVVKERELIGSFAYVDDFPRAIDLVASVRVPVGQFITGHIGLSEIVASGFEKMATTPDKHVRILVRTHE